MYLERLEQFEHFLVFCRCGMNVASDGCEGSVEVMGKSGSGFRLREMRAWFESA